METFPIKGDIKFQRAVLFDLDGVLIDSPAAHTRTWLEVFAEMGVQVDPILIYREEGRKAADIGRVIARAYGVALSEARLNNIINRKRKLYQSCAPKGFMDGARAVIDRLKTDGWAVGMVSGSVMENVREVLTVEDIALFDAIVLSGDYQRAKPDPQPYQTGCAKLKVHPNRTFAVENAPLGIRSAKAAGLKVAALTSTLPAVELGEADFVINHLEEVLNILTSASN